MSGFNTFASSCTVQNLLGTGSDECDLTSLDDVIGGALTTKDVAWTIASDPFLTTYKENVRKKKIFPMTSLYNFEQSTPDNEIATSSIGVKFEIREGKVEMSLIFNKSHCFHSSLFTKKAFKKWNLLLFMKNHTLGTTSIDGTKFKGFDMGMFSVSTFKVQQGTDPQQTKVTFQFTEQGTKEWNSRMKAIPNEEVAAELNSIDGVIETQITYVTAPAAGTTVVVDVKSNCNGTPKTGLTTANSASWILGGTQATPRTITTVAESATVPGRYTLTLSGALVTADTVQPRFGNATEYATEDILGNMYAGQALVGTV